MAKQIKYLDYEGLKALYGVVDGKITTAVNNAKGELKGSATTEYDTLGKLEDKIKENAAAIAAMDLTDKAVDGEFITTVSQSDGKVTIARAKVASDKVTAVAVTGDDTVAIEGTTVDAQIKSLGKTLKTVEGNAAHYKVAKLTEAEINKLSDGANVREAYKVVSWTGDEATAHPTQVGDTIKIYKDAALLSVTPENGVAGENTVIKFTYSLADGTQKEVSVDLGKAIFESEMGNGMQVVDHKIAIKLDAANEGDFLTVGADGLKLSGVQNAINTAVAAKNVSAEGDEYITADASGNKVTVRADVQGLTVAATPGGDSTISGTEKSLVDGKEVADKVAAFTNARIREEIAKLDATAGGTTIAEGNHVAVQVVETDGKITGVNVNEKDIASAIALTTETSERKAADDKIEASVGLAADGSHVTTTGNYTKEATTVVGEIAALDAQLKLISDKSGEINEDAQSIKLGEKELQFIAFTPDDRRKAADDAAGK